MEEISGLPRVEGLAILEGTVIVVADIISSHRPADATFRHLLHLHNQIILRVEHINHQHLEHQRRLGRDLSPCYERKSKIIVSYQSHIFYHNVDHFTKHTLILTLLSRLPRRPCFGHVGVVWNFQLAVSRV